jgi:hypothetical protein
LHRPADLLSLNNHLLLLLLLTQQPWQQQQQASQHLLLLLHCALPPASVLQARWLPWPLQRRYLLLPASG